MPIYTYRCENCGHQFDKHQSFSENPLKVCPSCHKHALHKVYFPAGVSFKGSGFYVTDKHKGSSATTSGQGKGKENGTKEIAAKESGTEKKTESKSEASNEKVKPPEKQTKKATE
jgi:putative FmdB family regulatory protein